MSFSASFTSNTEDVRQELESRGDCKNVPESVKEFIRQSAAALAKHDRVAVSAYGHLHSGEEGNYEPCTATINVSPSV
jgi:hypothetical protein